MKTKTYCHRCGGYGTTLDVNPKHGNVELMVCGECSGTGNGPHEDFSEGSFSLGLSVYGKVYPDLSYPSGKKR